MPTTTRSKAPGVGTLSEDIWGVIFWVLFIVFLVTAPVTAVVGLGWVVGAVMWIGGAALVLGLGAAFWYWITGS